MAKVKYVKKTLNSDLVGGDFTNTTSGSAIRLGEFGVTSNFEGRKLVDYSNMITSFPKPITLETLNTTESQSQLIKEYSDKLVLNYDKSDLRSFIKFGSTREYLRTSVENIIDNFVGSLYINNEYEKNTTIFDYSYDIYNDSSTFKIPSEFINNKYSISFDYGNENIVDGEVLKNLNISYNEYVIWRKDVPNNNFEIIGFTGDTRNVIYVSVNVKGNPFPEIISAGETSSKLFDYHIKPKAIYYNEFISGLEPFQQLMLGEKINDNSGYIVRVKQPELLDNGEVVYNETKLKWYTSDGYNLDTEYGRFDSFYETLLSIGENYDTIKSDLIARFLVPASFIDFDRTDNEKTKKLLRIYGREFDTIKQFIDSLVNINKVTYNKKNNIPDQLVKNLAKTFGWEDFSLIKSDKLIETFFDLENEVSNSSITPAELDIELWRRILINTQYFWKSKGNKDAIISMLLLVGIPKEFINISEYVYTVDGVINPNNVELTLTDIPSSSLPYDTDGYPVAPIENNQYYFQVSGNTDGGQAYFNLFRDFGFTLNRTVDNKKSWVQSGSTERIHYSTPNYYQEDSRLVLNTKEIDVGIDVARGVEYDVYEYIKNVDEVLNSTGYTAPFTFINLSLDYGSTSSTFIIPDEPIGDVMVSFNGVTLLSGATENEGDYHINPLNNKEIILNTESARNISATNRDIVVVTYLYERLGVISEGQIQYLVTKVIPNVDGTIIPLPDTPKGDVQLIVNGISLTQSTSLFVGDYIKDPNNEQQLIVQNNDLSQYLTINPILQIAMIVGDAEVSLEKKAEFHRVDSLASSKLYSDIVINKMIYRLNYLVSDVKNVKITVNGITLEPNKDYKINTNNKYEVILPPSIKIGDIIGAFYLINPTKNNEPIISDEFGLGSVGDMSFLEFIELIQRRKINARDRKIVSNYSGGFYPSLLELYISYLKRSNLSDNDPLKSNGYRFDTLYPYFDKYNSFFQNFVNQLLPATIIQKKSGFLMRNTVFTKQKFMYRRGVNFSDEIKWLGDDGSSFMKTLPKYEFEWEEDGVEILESKINPDFDINLISLESRITEY